MPILIATPPIPGMDRFGLPGPWQLFLLLYHVTLIVHLLLMNFVLGGAVVCLVNDICSMFSRNAGYLTDLNRRIFLAVPIALSFTITFGVAPLLFVQTLYGQFFYTATILIGLPWMAVIAVLIVAFYLVYAVRFGPAMPGRGRRAARIAVNLLVIAGVATVALMLTTEAVWSIIPEAWQGRNDNPSPAFFPPAAHFWPRYAHNLNGGLAMACLLFAGMARVLRRRGTVDEDWTRRTVRGFLLAAAVLTGVQLAAGAVLLWQLRYDVRDAMLLSWGNVHVWGWRVGLAAAIAGIVFLIRGIRQPARAAWTWLALLCMVVTVAGMSMARQAVRELYLGELFQLSAWRAKTQWLAMAVFIISFVVALGVVAWMLWLVWRPQQQEHGLVGPPPHAPPVDQSGQT